MRREEHQTDYDYPPSTYWFNWIAVALPGAMSENIVMYKIANLCTVLCAILMISVRNSYLLTK